MITSKTGNMEVTPGACTCAVCQRMPFSFEFNGGTEQSYELGRQSWPYGQIWRSGAWEQLMLYHARSLTIWDRSMKARLVQLPLACTDKIGMNYSMLASSLRGLL